MTDTDWKIEWATVYADAKHVAHAKREGRKLSVGDVVWRRAAAVGPLIIDHNHWTGWVLDCDEADVLLAASAPRLKAENERLVQEVERLTAENERLRETLQALVDEKLVCNVREADGSYIDVSAWCRAVLEKKEGRHE